MTDREKFEILRQICVDYGLSDYMLRYREFWEATLYLTPLQVSQDIDLVDLLLKDFRPINNSRARERLGQ